MTQMLDLDAYFARTGFAGDVRVDLDTLASLLHAHMRAIPFENLDVLLGRGVDLELAAVQKKLVAARRGGYCFEHATLFGAVLDALGFAPVRHSARVVLFTPRSESARSHMLLSVPLPQGTFVVDPGFGSLASEVPVPLVDAGTSPPDDGLHWFVRDGAYWVLRARRDGDVVDCWVTTLEADNTADFVVANHYFATHPASGFRQRLMLRALTPNGSVSVMNRDVTFRAGDATRSEQLADRAALRVLLRDHFGFDLPEAETLAVPSIEGWQ
jgi:N-hydroxyarylamine O-acetyltransferase